MERREPSKLHGIQATQERGSLMSVNAYLKDEVAELEGFIPLCHRVDGTIARGASFKGINVYGDKGVWYVSLGDHDIVPSQLDGLVERVTVRSWTPNSPNRETGVYAFKSATAEVKPGIRSGKTWIRHRRWCKGIGGCVRAGQPDYGWLGSPNRELRRCSEWHVSRRA